MCLAMLNNKTEKLCKEYFDIAWHNNKDGGGLLYVKDGKLIQKKILRDKDKFYDYYTEALKIADSPVIVHFRRANQGSATVKNCHPFVYDDIGFVHNGTIWSELPNKNQKCSDSYKFGKNIIKGLTLKQIKDPKFLLLLSYYVDGSRLIIMDKTADYLIVNEDSGHWLQNTWFSNKSYEKLRNEFDRDYGYCKKCDKALFGAIEETKTICYDCDKDRRRYI